MADVPLLQQTGLPPSRVGEAKPSFALADRSGERQLGQVIAGIGNETWTQLLDSKVANEKALFLGAEKTARERLNTFIIENPFANEADIRKAQDKMITEIEEAGQSSKLSAVKSYATNWMAENKDVLLEKSGNDITEIIKRREQKNFNAQMELYENSIDPDDTDKALALIDNHTGSLIDPEMAPVMKQIFEQNKANQFAKIAAAQEKADQEANKNSAMGDAFNLWQSTVTEENPEGDLNTAFDFIQLDDRISNDDKQEVESELKTRVKSRLAEDRLAIDAQRSEDLDKINNLIFFDKNYDAAMTAINVSSLPEKEQKTLFADVDRRATAATKGIPLTNNRVEEARLYEKSLDIWRGNVTKKEFDADLLKNSKKLDDPAYKRVSTSAANTLKSSQAEALSRSHTETARLIVDHKEDDAFKAFISASIKGLSPDAASLFQDNANEDRQLQFWSLSQYDAELRQWIEDNPNKLGKEFFQFQDQLKHQYWNKSIEDLRVLRAERGTELELAAARKRRGGNLRPDGTEKGSGFLGVLKLPDGSTTSEYSLGVRLEANDGKETDIPTLVPTLTKKEIQLMITDIIPNRKPVPASIVQKAVDHANKRVRAGKSVFKETGADVATITTQAEYDALPSGTRYKDVNGNVGTKP